MKLPFLRWREDWRQPGAIRADLLAGLTGAVVVLPQGVAFATLAGLPPQVGLYAAMLPCVVAAFFGSSRLMVTGPANAISLTTLALLAPLAAPFSERYVELAITLAFLVGVMQLALGLARAGTLVDKVPHAVVVGFTAGAAVLIVNAQLGALLGLTLPSGTAVWENVSAAAASLAQAQAPACITAALTLATALLARPFNRIVPSMLVAVVVGSLAAPLLGLLRPDWPALRMVGALPGALPPLSLPDLGVATVRSLFSATLVMTLLALTEASAIARSAARRRGDRLDGNQEFVGQGLANLAASFTSCFPVSGSFNRSGVNIESGARTPLAAASAAAFLLLILAFVGPLSRHLPLAVIAGLLVAVAWGLVDRPEVARLWREGPQSRIPLAVTFLTTVALSLEWAILLGITSALLVSAWARRRR
ncbi:MAG: SulP family inorganic anion transporter [Rubrivivax sp.]